MTLAEFRRTLSEPKPPVGLVPALAALWWAGKNDWHKAHKIVMDDEGRDCAWVHAYLHRVEGDLPNCQILVRRSRPARRIVVASDRMGRHRPALVER